MTRLSLQEYWECLERHDWFYAWTDGAEYAEHIVEAKRLWDLSKVSLYHGQLYSTYVRTMYTGLIMEDDDSVGNVDIPATNKPEAA